MHAHNVYVGPPIRQSATSQIVTCWNSVFTDQGTRARIRLTIGYRISYNAWLFKSSFDHHGNLTAPNIYTKTEVDNLFRVGQFKVYSHNWNPFPDRNANTRKSVGIRHTSTIQLDSTEYIMTMHGSTGINLLQATHIGVDLVVQGTTNILGTCYAPNIYVQMRC